MTIQAVSTPNLCCITPSITLEDMACGNPECESCSTLLMLYIGWLFWGIAIIFD